MLVLGIDTSCDDTSAAVVTGDFKILSNIVSSQDEVHTKFGGVVPELASRKHLENIIPIIDSALETAGVSLKEIDIIAVTQGPGLVGSLVSGISAAKAMSLALEIPLLGVNHIEGHIASSLLTEDPPTLPFVALVVSGGHTSLYVVREIGGENGGGDMEYILMGQTLDDAAGEAFDKVAKLLGLGYPGGRLIEGAAAAARDRGEEGVKFPRAYLEKDSFDFSFSGVKTSVRNFIKEREADGQLNGELTRRIALGFQEAVVEVLVTKSIGLALSYVNIDGRSDSIKTVVLCGGVASNSALREAMIERANEHGIRVVIPKRELCTDNGAMIGAVGVIKAGEASLERGDMNAISRMKI
ncbi:MAG: tRNA (adenosine(37)-N6)-threonylcarbamoyltransferase complex transferase subunit TsaD [Deltaproteobacteria bacterium]|uniref:tRNA N6-adenosine threonylcarbamoyltransferase n=1 Tax=Candidatus Zymogenus saltonus TaxID=2844893 RepID=A0A9D8KD84_9DELT|nr:tRNA (adenosine(37)-N6)-threonylcarbamoyltransferase complex transferase subunit TsaD [Candidatus Zymogenus saltonus]